MLKWVVTRRGPSTEVPTSVTSTPPRVPPVVAHVPTSTPGTKRPPPPPECPCDKENHCQEQFTSFDNNNSYPLNDLGNCYSPRQCRLSSGPVNRSALSPCTCFPPPPPEDPRHRQDTPVSTRLRSHPHNGRRKLRTRRERNRTLAKRLTAANLSSLAEELTTPPPLGSPRGVPNDLFQLYRDPCGSAQLLQSFLNSTQAFQEREVRSPENSSLLEECGHLFRQRAVRRRQSRMVPSVQQQQQQQILSNDSASAFFNAFVFRELAQEMLV